MNLLRRLLGGGTSASEPRSDPVPAADVEALERDHELELLRAENERLDELQKRQLRYESYAWEPPAQGGELRAEDNDATSKG